MDIMSFLLDYIWNLVLCSIPWLIKFYLASHFILYLQEITMFSHSTLLNVVEPMLLMLSSTVVCYSSNLYHCHGSNLYHSMLLFGFGPEKDRYAKI